MPCVSKAEEERSPAYPTGGPSLVLLRDVRRRAWVHQDLGGARVLRPRDRGWPRRALYHFGEGSEKDIYRRLVALGLSDDRIAKNFMFVAPETSITTPGARERLDEGSR